MLCTRPVSEPRSSFAPAPSADKTWESVQAKSKYAWVNARLSENSLGALNNICTDFHDGTALIHLLEIIGDERLGRYNRTPRMRIQKVENVNLALDYIRMRGISLTNIGAEDIVDSNPKLILGMVWTIILRAKEGLLLWCQRKTAPYQDVDRDIHGNTALAFEVAERYLGIPKLLDVEDVCDTTKPDERSIMTYVAQYFHAFSSLNKAETAGRRLGNLSTTWRMTLRLRVARLIDAIHTKQDEWRRTKFETSYASARKHSDDFNDYKTKRATYNLSPFVPRPGLSPRDLEAAWSELAEAEVKHRKTINQCIRESQDRLQRAYGDEANGIMATLNSISSGLSALSGDLNDQQATVDALYATAEPLSAALKRVSVLEQKCIDANIDEYDYTGALEKKSQFIENQNVARNMTNLTPAQLEEFESTFKHFDRDDTNVLHDIEFRTAMESLGSIFRFLVELTEDQTTPEQLLESFRVIAADKDYVTEGDLRMSDLSPAIYCVSGAGDAPVAFGYQRLRLPGVFGACL
ncbi:hypothetical protein DL89DRAFT_277901 [Linderina pennispora]|uniref:Actinin-like protein n=1 Tax=Linderina pennispora TaxID=61395 RepID=A0A1Y1WDE1_9FUNG|nr:uncharacterized protein DL89DRAFT_277901 [Linderina pennispora]ORX71472.1 hypothetical protein DL89DRAFT_277901 [Linderina pennispora]